MKLLTNLHNTYYSIFFRERILTYYNDLAAEADRRKIHADWRIRRMQLFDDRVAAISEAKNEASEMIDELKLRDFENNKQVEEKISTNNEKKTSEKNAEKKYETTVEDLNLNAFVPSIEFGKSEVDANANEQEDENSNVAQVRKDCIEVVENLTVNGTTKGTQANFKNQNSETIVENVTIRSPRPTVLNITPISLSTEPIEIRQDLLAKETLQKNKNRVMGHSTFLGEDYYEEYDNKKNNLHNVFFDRTEITNEAVANRLRNTGCLDAFAGLDKDSQVTTSNNEVIIDRLDIIEFGNPDNMTELQRNKLKVLQEEYNWTPNNNDIKIISSDRDKFKTGSVEQTQSNDISESMTANLLSEMEVNRNRNVQHRTDQGQNYVSQIKNSVDYDLTDAQKNRNKNMVHRTGQDTPTLVITENVATELTDAQKNRNRNMQHSTDQGINYSPDESGRSQPGALTQAQKNRARVMEQEFYIYGSSTDGKSKDQIDFEAPFPISESASSQQMVFENTTPMSCTTDNFPLSMSSSMSQFQQCMDTPLSEMSSEIRSALNTGEILTADTVRSDITESGFKFPERSPMFPNFLGFSSAAMTPTSESVLTVTDVEMTDNTSLHVYLEKSVIIPLQVQSRLVNDAIIKYLLNEHKLLSHLHSLRSYFFLLNGEFAKNLTKSLFTRLYEITSPADLLNSATLNNLLNKALVASLSGSYANSERLSLSVTGVPSQLQVIFYHFMRSYQCSLSMN